MEKFNLMGQEILISHELNSFNNIRKTFYNCARLSQEKFQEIYKKKINSLDELVEKIPEIAVNLIESTVEVAIGKLVELGIMTCNKNAFINMYGENFNYSEYFDPIFEKYIEIAYAYEELEYYREVQKSGRSRWQGGGFGLGGAIKGVATAGMLNMGTDLLRGVGDRYRSASDSNKIDELKDEIFTKKSTLKHLSKGIFNCCFDVFYGFLNEIEKYDKKQFVRFDEDKADAIYENVKNYIKDKNQAQTYIIECINIYPYNLNYYKYLIDEFSDINNEVENIASYFGFEPEIKKYKSDKAVSKIQTVLNLPENTLEEIEKKKKCIIAKSSELNFNCSDEIKRLEEVLNGNFKFNQNNNIKADIGLEIRNGIFHKTIHYAKLGNLYAQFALEQFYFEKRRIMNTFIEGVKQEEAKGDAFFQYILGRCYIKGVYSVQKNIDTGVALIEKSFKRDCIPAQNFLGWLHLSGDSVLLDEKLGYDMIKKAADYGYADAQYNLGYLYGKGEHGVIKNLDESDKWYETAVKQGHELAKAGMVENRVARDGSNSNNSSNSGCFITTACCLSLDRPDNCYELNLFRNFRDNWLKKAEDGNDLINEYYEIAPNIVSNINCRKNQNDIYNIIWKKYLYTCLKYLEGGMYEECKSLYVKMVNGLKAEYLK